MAASWRMSDGTEEDEIILRDDKEEKNASNNYML